MIINRWAWPGLSLPHHKKKLRYSKSSKLTYIWSSANISTKNKLIDKVILWSDSKFCQLSDSGRKYFVHYHHGALTIFGLSVCIMLLWVIFGGEIFWRGWQIYCRTLYKDIPGTELKLHGTLRPPIFVTMKPFAGLGESFEGLGNLPNLISYTSWIPSRGYILSILPCQ